MPTSAAVYKFSLPPHSY